jgi:hypothetical protein
MIAEIGARKIASEAMKVKREDAEEMIFHGTITQPPIIVVMIAPRRILIYLGKRVVYGNMLAEYPIYKHVSGFLPCHSSRR